MLRSIVAGWLAVVCVGATAAAEHAPLFPFVISYDAPENATNVSAWIERPAGGRGFVRADGEQLLTDAGPIRFWGVNLCFEACFPEHDVAERVAARLARLGFNCVRMHHMDSRSIWGGSPDKLTIDPEKLGRLDYLIYQLKQHGIYTNLNLHVSRTLGPAEGFPNVEGRPKYDKGVGNFDPRMIEAQRKYARDLLTHVNPYTKNPYTSEPAVAFIEISNEDALAAVWSRGQLDGLPEPYAATFRELWNGWLKKKYGTTERLRSAWNVGAEPLGNELLENGDFREPPEGTWHLERDEKTEVEWSVDDAGPEGAPRLRIVVTRTGEVSWRPQLSQAGFALKQGERYTLSFSIRSDQQRSLGVNCMMAHDPWQRLGLSHDVEAGPQWQQRRVTFLATKDDDNARVTFTNLEPGTYDLAGVSLRPGGIVGLGPGQRLEDQSVPVLQRGALATTEAARQDFIHFICDTEHDYWLGMYRYLKHDLRVKSLISGTQAGYGPLTVQAELDYVDAHAYWKHPRFPNRPWDPRDWFVEDVAMVNDPPGTLGSLAGRRVAGMAYTVSEYNHPMPNRYGAEGFPMIAAFGAFQAWNGVLPFAYCHNSDFEPGRIASFFDLKANTHKLAHMPACAAMFLRGDVAAAREVRAVAMSREAERAALTETLNPFHLSALNLGIDWPAALKHRVALGLSSGTAARGDDTAAAPEGVKAFDSDTGQLRGEVSQEGAGYFTVDTPRTRLFTGFVRGRTFDLGDMKLSIGPTRLDWATVSMTCLDGEGFNRPGRVLIAATGLVQNTGAEVEELDGDRITLRNQWGEAPVLCEGIPADIQLPVDAGRVALYPLDESGDRGAPVAVIARHGRTVLPLGPEQKTVWYEAEVW